ncbi:MAG: hypothetical protein ABI980_10875 [Nitrospirota bacterium]
MSDSEACWLRKHGDDRVREGSVGAEVALRIQRFSWFRLSVNATIATGANGSMKLTPFPSPLARGILADLTYLLLWAAFVMLVLVGLGWIFGFVSGVQPYVPR